MALREVLGDVVRGANDGPIPVVHPAVQRHQPRLLSVVMRSLLGIDNRHILARQQSRQWRKKLRRKQKHVQEIELPDFVGERKNVQRRVDPPASCWQKRNSLGAQFTLEGTV